MNIVVYLETTCCCCCCCYLPRNHSDIRAFSSYHDVVANTLLLIPLIRRKYTYFVRFFNG